MKNKLFAIALLVLSCAESKKKEKTFQKEEKKLTARLDSLLKTKAPREFNGVVYITKNDSVLYSKAYGYSDFESKSPISLDDNFRIQSNSKQITAVLILKEFERGNINLQNSIREYLPYLKQSWADKVTVHQLLNMSSGITSLDKPLLFEPGTDFHYSNPAYGLLGRIIKNVTGKAYSELANNLFKELGMNNTFCYQFGGNNQKLINGYQWTGNAFEIVKFSELGFTKDSWDDFIPTGGIISNLSDLHLWDTKLHNGELLKPSSYEIMINSEIPDLFSALSDEKMTYGYGIDIAEKPFKYLGHGGSGFGFVNIKFYVPEKKLNIIVLENLFHDDIPIRYHFEKEIRKLVINSEL